MPIAAAPEPANVAAPTVGAPPSFLQWVSLHSFIQETAMPYYEVIASEGTLTKERRAKVAGDITDIHCEETGAPRSFVHVHYKEYQKDTQYTAGKPDNGVVIVFCNIRAGRSLAERQRLLKRISGRVSTSLDKPEGELILSVNEINASTAMEFGLILPHPGGEPEWFEKHADVLTPYVDAS